jgi:DNA-binding MarR family transcriptional regulator
VERVSPHRRRRQVLITARDRLILETLAEHRLIVPAHVHVLLGVSVSTASGRLRALASEGYVVARRVFADRPTNYQITRKGLAAVGSHLPAPQLDLRAHAHDVGVAWLWLAARSGTFGPLSAVVSERTMRSLDARRDSQMATAPGPLGVRLGGTGPAGRERLHYPDLLLITADGRRIAVELELSAKGAGRRDKILAGYGADPRIDAVLYLVNRPALAIAIRSSARRLGIAHHVHVQWVRRSSGQQTRPGPAVQRAPAGPTTGRER